MSSLVNMSRIGKKLIKLPEQVGVNLAGQRLTISGLKGTLEFTLPKNMKLIKKEEDLTVESLNKSRQGKALHGLTRAVVANMVKGVSEGFRKELELSGVGYRAQVEGDILNLNIGFSHPVRFKAPSGISLTVRENRIIIEGADKQLVGDVTSKIRRLRPPEPYKGKGIKYLGEKIRRKAGKAAKTVGGVK